MTAKILDITKHPKWKKPSIYKDFDSPVVYVGYLGASDINQTTHAEDAIRYSMGPYQTFKIEPVNWGILYD